MHLNAHSNAQHSNAHSNAQHSNKHSNAFAFVNKPVYMYHIVLVYIQLCWSGLIIGKYNTSVHPLSNTLLLIIHYLLVLHRVLYSILLSRNLNCSLEIKNSDLLSAYCVQVKHASQMMPDQDGGILIVCIGAASGISRIVCGRIADLSISRIRMMQVRICHSKANI